jgi:hypothetical protein
MRESLFVSLIPSDGKPTCLTAIDATTAWAKAIRASSRLTFMTSQTHGPMRREYWFRALYGVGDMFITLDRAGHATTAGRQHRELLERASGAVEDVAPLLNPDRGGISGVLGSAADAGNLPNPLGDDFLLMPHSAGYAPYPPGLVKRGAEIMLRLAEDGQYCDIETIDYGAHTPLGPVQFAVEFDGARHEGEWAVDGRNLSVRIASWHSTVPIQAGDDPAVLAEQNAVGILSVLLSRRRKPKGPA